MFIKYEESVFRILEKHLGRDPEVASDPVISHDSTRISQLRESVNNELHYPPASGLLTR